MQQEQQARLQLVQRQQARLRQQERHVHEARLLPAPAAPTTPSGHPPSQPRPSLWGRGQEHLSLAQQRLRLDRIRQDLPSGPAALFPGTQCPAASCLSGEWLPKGEDGSGLGWAGLGCWGSGPAARISLPPLG